MQRTKKDEEAGSGLASLDKISLLQECRLFNEISPSAEAVLEVLQKLCFYLGQGSQLTKSEASDVFFAATKLFRLQDPRIRRLLYIVIKQLHGDVDESIIIVQSLLKDMTFNDETVRAGAMRVLCELSDPTTLSSNERHFKNAVVDNSNAVSSAALVSGIHLYQRGLDIPRRWHSQLIEVMKSRSGMPRYHALVLQGLIRKNDFLAMRKLVTGLSQERGSGKGVLFGCYLVKLTADLLDRARTPEEVSELKELLWSQLSWKWSKSIVFQGCKSIVQYVNRDGVDVTSGDVAEVVRVLKSMLRTGDARKHGAIRLLSKLVARYPAAVAAVQFDLESVISEKSPVEATYAITTLLQCCYEFSVESLLNKAGKIIDSLDDDQKIVVVEAIAGLVTKFPQQRALLLRFLSNILREEGSYRFRKAILDAMMLFLEDPLMNEKALLQLGEFIEDCEYPELSCRILALYSEKVPEARQPHKFLRFIFNRVLLEVPRVRAAGVDTLGKIAVKLPDLRPSVCTLLRGALRDSDDEVRDRAIFFLRSLETQDDAANKLVIHSDAGFDSVALEASLMDMLNSGVYPDEVDIEKLAVKAAPPEAEVAVETEAAAVPVVGAPVSGGIDDKLGLGPAIYSGDVIDLMDPEAEFHVSVRKVMYSGVFVLHFTIVNTLDEQQMEAVDVALEAESGEDLEFESERCALIAPHDSGDVYVKMETGNELLNEVAVGVTLKYVAKILDAGTGEETGETYDEEYPLEGFDISPADSISALGLSGVEEFEERWNALPVDSEVSESFVLSAMESIADAVTNVHSFLHMWFVESEAESGKLLMMAGKLPGNQDVLVRAKFSLNEQDSVNMDISVRSDSIYHSEAITQAIC